MTSGITLVSFVLLTVANYLLGGRRVLYPPFVYSAVWSLDLTVFAISPIQLSAVHSITWWTLIALVVVFSVGGRLSGLVPSYLFTSRVKELSHPTASRLGRIMLLAICILGTPIMLHDVLQRGSGGTGKVLAEARVSDVEMAEEGISPNPVVSKLPLFSICVTLLCLIEDRDILFWIALPVSLACCILTAGRTWVLTLLCSVAAAMILRKRRDNLAGLAKFALVPFLLFVVLFIVLTFAGKDVANYRGNVAAILENFLLLYIVTPIPAFDYVLTHAAEYAHDANHTFAFWSDFVVRLGYDVKVAPPIDAWVAVPMPTNVYTAYKFPFTDFGYIGLLALFGIIGFVQTAIYRRAVAGGRISLYISALLVYPMIMTIFDDMYTRSIFLTFKALVLAIVYYGLLSRIRLGADLPRLRVHGWNARRREA